VWWKPRPFRQLDEIQQALSTISRRLDKMGTDIHALDTALATLTSDVATLKTAVEALIAAIPPGDFTTEIEAVQAAFGSVEQTTQEAQGATPPPPA
jgi:prefoldin subunit 5